MKVHLHALLTIFQFRAFLMLQYTCIFFSKSMSRKVVKGIDLIYWVRGIVLIGNVANYIFITLNEFEDLLYEHHNCTGAAVCVRALDNHNRADTTKILFTAGYGILGEALLLYAVLFWLITGGMLRTAKDNVENNPNPPEATDLNVDLNRPQRRPQPTSTSTEPVSTGFIQCSIACYQGY